MSAPAGTEQWREPLLTPAETAALCRADPKTVTRWVKTGRLNPVRTPGGTRRYRESEVRALMAGRAPRRQGTAVEPVLTPGEAADLAGVKPRTITRWANAGKLTTTRTTGGHRRFSGAEVLELLARRGAKKRIRS